MELVIGSEDQFAIHFNLPVQDTGPDTHAREDMLLHYRLNASVETAIMAKSVDGSSVLRFRAAVGSLET